MPIWPEEYNYHYNTPTPSFGGGGAGYNGGGSGRGASSSVGGGMQNAIYDLSFAGSKITIGGATITEFMDDSNPIDIQDTDSCNIEWSCNGRMIRTVKPSAVMLSITVIPGSASDSALRTIWKKRFSNGGSVDLGLCDQPLTCNITLGNPKKGKFMFTNGTVVSGAAAITSNGQGKMGGNTYTFAFERVE